MRAGALRHRVTIQQVVETPEGQFNSPEESWVPFAACWASIEPLSGRELFAAQELHAEVTHRVILRYLPGLTAKMRILLAEGRTLDIQAVLNLEERNRELTLMCKERAGS